MNFLIYILINLLCGVITMMLHELPKNIAAHFLTHPLHRGNRIKWVSPLRYIDPIGLILFAVSGGLSRIGIGWQKPYEYNPNKLVQKNKSLLPIMLVGQLSSVLVCLFFIPIYKVSLPLVLFGVGPYIRYFAIRMIYFNIMIFVVNLLPMPPFDMGYILYSFSPDIYFRLVQNKQYILSAFMLVVAFGILEQIGTVIVMFISTVFF